LKQKKWKKALKESCDIVAVAGGDGTVGRVARHLIGGRKPIAILPTGTANNIATTLGLSDQPLHQLINGWNTAPLVNFDAGVAAGPWGSECFIEGFGVGLLAEAIAQLQKSKRGNVTGSVRKTKGTGSALSILERKLTRVSVKEMIVLLDGEDFSGDYILVETLNTRYIGPNLKLVPNADVSDGLFDVVFVAAHDRSELRRYLAALNSGKSARPNLRIRRCRRLEIEVEGSSVHIDDTCWPEDDEDTIPSGSRSMDIRIQKAALFFLTQERQSIN
jgi:diacylglycerol kinase family enzyme